METKDKKRVIKIIRKKEPPAESVLIDKGAVDSFWKPKTLDELAREQGAKPFNPAIIGKDWPEDADFDDFMAAINEGRKYPREW
jgi:hypothetical protein